MPDFVCPDDRSSLALDVNALVSASGRRYPVIDGIPDFVRADDAAPSFGDNADYYRRRADEYDRGNDVMFKMLLCDEAAERNAMIDLLRLAPRSKVLEIGCGTCRDTVHLLARGASIWAGDLSREMLTIGRERLRTAGADQDRLSLFRANAMALPFAEAAFDAVFHFGGLNLFEDVPGALREMARVTCPGGRVVAGDEGIAPWLADSEFGAILRNSNSLFAHSAPLAALPAQARDASCHWVLGGAFYCLAFTVGDTPTLDLDVEFPGARGGSHRTRFFGRLEGIDPKLRDEARKAAAREGLSMTRWLERAIRTATEPNKNARD